MRKTVYPFAVIIALPLVILVFIVLNQGQFKQTASSTTFKNEQMTESYFTWKGFGKPHIKSVNLEENREEMSLVAYSSTKGTIVKKMTESMIDEIEHDLPNLVIQMESFHHQQLDTMPVIIVRYSLFGINKEQRIEVKK